MPLSTTKPAFADDPTDPDGLLVTLGDTTWRVSKNLIGCIVDGHRDFTMIPAQLANLLAGPFANGAAVQAADAAQIQQTVDGVLAAGGAFYW